MKLKVKQKELTDVTDIMKKGGEDYDAEIESMLKEIEKLRKIWIGEDATIFCDKVSAYITKMKNIPVCLRNMSDFTKKSITQYKEKDEAYAKEMNKEANNFDEPNGNYERATIPRSN